MNMPTVLRADDNDDDNLLLRQACRKNSVAFRLEIVTDGQTAISYLSGAGIYSDRSRFPLPELLLLDLKMPRKNGFEVLDWLRKDPFFQNLPVSIFSSSQNSRDLEQAYTKGATWFLMKPADFRELEALARAVGEWLVTKNQSVFQHLTSYRSGDNGGA
jgi:CheY-like chemotaxis protein